MSFNPFNDKPVSRSFVGSIHYGLRLGAVVAVCAAAFIFGSYPLWISGFVISLACCLGAVLVAIGLFGRINFFPVPNFVFWMSQALIGWLVFAVLWDTWFGVGGERMPALSVRMLPYAAAFLAAGMLGAGMGSRKNIRVIYYALTATGFVLGLLTIFQAIGMPVKQDLGIGRPSGILINPNRFAVMEALCFSTGLGLFLAEFYSRQRHGRANDRRSWQFQQWVWSITLSVMAVSLVLTLSRATVVAFGLGLGVMALIWVRGRWQKDVVVEFQHMTRAQQIQRVVFIASPLLVMLGAWVAAMVVGEGRLAHRFSEFESTKIQDIDRVQAVTSAVPLLISKPLMGHGLGSFESLFTAFQPGELRGRYNRLHSDWMQLAIEAGFPALLLALGLLASWLRAWWHNLGKWHSEKQFILVLVPLSGVFTVLVCSAVDFPLREPAVALSFFLLVGAMARSESLAGKIKRHHSVLTVPLLLLFVWSAWISGRNALAYASSPAFGQLRYPPDVGSDVYAWKKAVEIDSGDPQVHFFLAAAANNDKHQTPERLNLGLEHAKIAAALSPRDYVIPWVAALLSEKLGRQAEATEFLERAQKLYPENPALHLDLGAFYLRRYAQGIFGAETDRTQALQSSQQHFKLALKRDQGALKNIVDWMESAGCTGQEIAVLWEDNSPKSHLQSARFYWNHNQPDLCSSALKALNKTISDPGSKMETADKIWLHVLSGCLDLHWERTESGVAHWRDALSYKEALEDSDVLETLASQCRRLDEPATMRVVSELGAWLHNANGIVEILISNLRKYNKLALADDLLKMNAGNSETLQKAWAEISLERGDLAAADLHARTVMNLAGRLPEWRKWYAEFVRSIEAKSKGRP